MTELRAVAYGGGIQSTSLLVLAAQQRIDYPLFLMANVGDDSEHPDTLTYVRDVAAPYAADHDIELQLLDRRRRDGSVETLYGRLMRDGSRFLGIPVRMGADGAPGRRSCTSDFKISVIAKELKRRGANTEHPATLAMGISLDEIHRAANRRTNPHERVVYPLISIGDDTGLKMRRDDCARVIREAGLPVPPKSACWFCPFHTRAAWADLARQNPELFEASAEIEDTLNARRAEQGKTPVWLSSALIPLRDAIDTDQPVLPLDDGDGSCDSGWCFT